MSVKPAATTVTAQQTGEDGENPADEKSISGNSKRRISTIEKLRLVGLLFEKRTLIGY